MNPRLATVLCLFVPLSAGLPGSVGQDDKSKKKDDTTFILDNGEFPKTFKRKVFITGRTLSYDDCNRIRNSTEIRHLRLKKVFVEGKDNPDAAMQRLYGMRSLEILELVDSSGDFLQQLDAAKRKKLLPGLKTLKIRHDNLNWAGQQIPSDWVGWRFLETMPALEELHITGAAFPGRSLKGQKLATLKRGSFIDTNVVDSELAIIAAATPGVEELTFERARLNGKGLKALTALKSLRKLALVTTALDEANLEALKGCAALEELILHRSDGGYQDPIGETGARHIAAIPKLKTVLLRSLNQAALKVLRDKAPSVAVEDIQE